MTVKGDAGCVCSVCVCVGGVSYKQHSGQAGLEEKSLTPSGIALAA